MIERQPIVSSNLATVGYDAADLILEVEFTNGHIYQYYDVPEAVYHELIGSESPGSYLNTQIKNQYRYARI
jgi:KTSC domain